MANPRIEELPDDAPTTAKVEDQVDSSSDSDDDAGDGDASMNSPDHHETFEHTRRAEESGLRLPHET